VAEGAHIDIARERDQALGRLRVLAAEIRVHEQSMRRSITSRSRPADERLYRRLRQVNGGSDDEGNAGIRGGRQGPQPIVRQGAGPTPKGRGLWG
jgi:hypothetical protein